MRRGEGVSPAFLRPWCSERAPTWLVSFCCCPRSLERAQTLCLSGVTA